MTLAQLIDHCDGSQLEQSASLKGSERLDLVRRMLEKNRYVAGRFVPMVPSPNVFHQATESQVQPSAVGIDFLIPFRVTTSGLSCWESAIRLHLIMILSQCRCLKNDLLSSHISVLPDSAFILRCEVDVRQLSV